MQTGAQQDRLQPLRDAQDGSEPARRALLGLCYTELRRFRAAKRQAPAVFTTLVEPGIRTIDLDIERLDAALRQLAAVDPARARLVELRFFAGLSVDETAEVLGLSAATVKRRWDTSRAWLLRHLSAVP
jgi:RNA polymerase sigma factor (sigma-70 family)